MMDDIKIKNENSDNQQLQCRGCLSVDRKLRSIGKYLDLFKTLTLDYITYSNTSCTNKIKFCWECYSLLRRVFLFRQQVIKASEMMKSCQSYVYGTLSCLTTVVVNDTQLHTIYFNETKSQTSFIHDGEAEKFHNSEAEHKLKKDLLNNLNDDHLSEEIVANDEIQEFNFDGEDIKTDSTDGEIVKKEITVQNDVEIKSEGVKQTKTSKWAKKRSLQNKKPKFKIIAHSELEMNEMFRKIHIDTNQVRKCMAQERDSDIYKASLYKCESCVKVLKNSKLLKKHNSMWHDKNVGPCVCDICRCRMSKDVLSSHIQNHFTAYECNLCKLLCRKKEVGKHLEDKHSRVFQCLKCDLKFCCRRDFYRHFKDWHEKFICDICGVSFKMRYCIKDHLRKQHSAWECVPCSKRFARYNGLWLHNKLRHAPPLPPAYCVECDKQYADVYRYRWHLANSARHKPKKKVRIPCPDCEKVFSKRIYMTNHYDLVHLKQYRYRCEQCNKNFIRNADLVKHNRRVHEGILPPRNKICYVCGRGFTSNKILSNHVRTHTGERPHACARCPATFAQRAALRGHVRALHAQP